MTQIREKTEPALLLDSVVRVDVIDLYNFHPKHGDKKCLEPTELSSVK